MTPRRSLATLAVVLLILVGGVALLYGFRSQQSAAVPLPVVTQGITPSPVQGSAAPTPTGATSALALPANCRVVTGPTVQSGSTGWSFDCGSANPDAKATVKPTLVQQGWVSCGGAGGRDVYTKGNQTLYVEAPGSAPGALPNILIENTRVGNCP